MIADVLENTTNNQVIERVKQQALDLCAKHPVYK
jgi:glycine/serine hydroxymethyltransferase